MHDITQGNSLQDSQTPLSSKGAHTLAPNTLPSPPATAGSVKGSKPGAKDPSQPGIRKAW